MANELQSFDDRERIYEELKQQTTEALEELIEQMICRTVAELMEMAQAVRILDERGIDTSRFRIGLASLLLKVAFGQLLPRIVWEFYGTAVLKKLETLPIADQLKFTDPDKTVKVWMLQNGEVTNENVVMKKLNREQIEQVFAYGRLRTDAEQVAMVRHRAAQPVEAPPRPAKIRADRQKGGLVVGRKTFIPQLEILDALSQLHPEAEDSDKRANKLTVSLSDEELRRLKVRAAESKRTTQELVRALLRAGGGI